MRKPIEKVCLECNNSFTTTESRAKFCSRSCAAKHTNNNHSSETKERIRQGLIKFWKEHPEKQSKGIKHARAVAKYTKGKYREYAPESIISLSKRTVSKIFKRLELGCSRCGWKESSCDVHHINGKKIDNQNSHSNLTYICPNCHRLVHTHKIQKQDLVTLDKYIGDTWKQFYYG